ncbi:MAG: hypothetical protein ACLTXM_10285, partial [Enterococcus sp.]
MNKKMKRISIFLLLISIAVGLTSKPQISEAALPFTMTKPKADIYYEFVDAQGNELPVTMGMEANYVTASGVDSSGYPATLLSVTPLSITKTSGKNTFALNIPAFNHTLTVLDERYYEFVSDLKINTPLPCVRHINIIPIDYTLPRKDSYHQYNYTNGYEVTSLNPNFGNYLKLLKNGDDTYTLRYQSYNYVIIGGYESTLLGQRIMTTASSGNGYAAHGLDGDTIRVYIYYYQVQEIFEDETGSLIPAPSGFTNQHYTNITSQPFNYQMDNDSSLPKTYTDSNFIYTYKGWYKGKGNQSNTNTSYPPSIGFNAQLINDPQNEVHIVYNKKALRIVNEEYIDTTGATIESSWNNMGQQKADGDTLTQTPAATKTDSSGVDWEYQGWKLDTEPMSAMKTTPVSVLIDANKTVQYVYKKVEHTLTEKFVDQADGTTLIPMTGNPNTSSIDDNDDFTGTAPATVTDTGNGIWDFVGWENVTDAPGTVNSAPAYAINNIKGNKEIRYHYQARNTTAT